MSYWSKAVKWISQAKKVSGQPSNTQVFIWKVLNCLAHASTKDICRVSTTSSSVCMFIQETFENHFWEVILPGTVHLTPGFFHITPSPLRMLFLTCCVAQFYENKTALLNRQVLEGLKIPPVFTGTMQCFTVNTINIYGQLWVFFFFQPGHQKPEWMVAEEASFLFLQLHIVTALVCVVFVPSHKGRFV